MSTRRRVGPVRVDFSVIERLAREAMQDMPLSVVSEVWTLSKKSSLHRRKDGSYTLCLIWISAEGFRMSGTYRGLRSLPK